MPVPTIAADRSRMQHQRGVMLAYTFGTNMNSCPSFFVRSWDHVARTVGRHGLTELIILYEGSEPPCRGEAVAMNMRYEPVPQTQSDRWRNISLGPIPYRLFVCEWWLQTHGRAYAYAGFVDSDMIFQSDIFDALYRRQSNGPPKTESLHLPGQDRGTRWVIELPLFQSCN